MNKLKSINVFGIGLDNTVEAFHIREKKILGIMWHPESIQILRILIKN